MSSSSSSWKNPSAQHMQKYGLVPLPDDFEPTQEEQMLLDTYDTIQKYERQANRLKEEAARAKLAASEALFQQKTAPKKKKKRKRVKAPTANTTEEMNDEAEDEDEDFDEDTDAEGQEYQDDDYHDDDEQQQHQSLHERREAKLAALREEVEEAAKQQKSLVENNQQDALREEHLQTAQTELDEGPALKRKRIETTSVEPSSLIANLTAGATPPHDFSKKLGLTPVHGKVLFPTLPDKGKWTPPEGVFSPNENAFMVELQDFDVSRAQYGQGNNTLAIKFMAPSDSKRFSLNIASANNDDFNSILFHFNPRQHERGGQLVINDKQNGIWGQSIAIPLSQVPLIFGQTACTLMIQINGEGFDVFLEEKQIARLEHRVELPSSKAGSLVLQFPSTDDYGSPENWAVFKVWWGSRPIMAQGDLSGIAGVNSYNALHPRKLFVSGLVKIFTEPEVDLRRAELERAFHKYGGDRGVTVLVPTNSTYAFVEMESERQTDLALSEMAGQYRLNRARRSRHEALQEERVAKEALKSGGGGGAAKKETGDWD